MDVTKPYEFIRFGAMDVTTPYEFIGCGAMDVTKPYEFIGFDAMDATRPYEFIGFGEGCRSIGSPDDRARSPVRATEAGCAGVGRGSLSHGCHQTI